MGLWKVQASVDDLDRMSAGTMLEALGIRFKSVGEDSIEASMPVDARTRQPAGLLHGGASVVLAESLGSTASSLCAPPPRYRVVGLEINANHIRGVTGGHVHGVARPIHVGRSTHVWDIRISDDAGALACISRLTVAVIDAGGAP